MARSFFKKSKKVLLSVSLLTSLMFGVFALPLYTINADDSDFYQIGVPYFGDDYVVRNTNYPQNIHNYYDLVWFSAYEVFLSYFQENNLGTLTYQQFGQFFTSLSPSSALALSQSGYDPDVLINVYVSFFDSYFTLYLDLYPQSLLIDSPSYFRVDSNHDLYVYTGNLPFFIQSGNRNDPVYTILNHKFNGETEYTSYPATRNTGLTPYTYSSSSHQSFVVSADYSLNVTYSTIIPDGYYGANASFNALPVSLSCIVCSYPFYIAPSLRGVIYQPYAYLTGNSITLIPNHSTGYSEGTYYFDLCPYTVYSEFTFQFYPSPTPYPTALPTISPTPLPLGYDTDVSGTNDALGYLSTLGDYFTNILSTWTVIPLLATTLGYVFHYSPWFGIALLVPTIALLSLLIGRNKS